MKENLKSKSIGVFDSGIGGLTVVKEIMKLLPNENIVYFGDTARVPYGTKSPRTITHFAKQDAHFLISQGVKMIVVACNTASSNSLETLRKELDIPVIGVIEPGIKGAEKYSLNKNIGVIGTRATINSKSYQNKLEEKGFNVSAKACPLLVPIAEEGWINHPATQMIVEEYLQDIKDNIDTLILGCTHYPILYPVIENVLGESVHIVNSGYETALEVNNILKKENLLNDTNNSVAKFFVSDMATGFKEMAERFLGKQINSLEIVDIEKF